MKVAAFGGDSAGDVRRQGSALCALIAPSRLAADEIEDDQMLQCMTGLLA
jgi:hypothetical protein